MFMTPFSFTEKIFSRKVLIAKEGIAKEQANKNDKECEQTVS